MRFVIFALFLARLAVPPAFAQDSYDADAESKIISLERVAKHQACPAKDIKTLDTLLDDTFVNIDEQGRVQTKAEVLLLVQTANSVKYVPDKMMVRLHGDTAIATGLYTVTGMFERKPFAARGRFVDTWMLKKGQWVAIASLSTPAP